MSDVPAVIAAARDNGFATLGGQIQFRCPTGTYEFYWLNADSGDRRPAETWQEYVARSAEDVMTGSGSLPQTVEALMPEINAWPALAAGHRAGLELGRYLCFVLYFHDETEAA